MSDFRLSAARELLAELGFEPVYLIDIVDGCGAAFTEPERQFIFSPSHDDGIACTSPVCDLMFKSGRLKYEYQGRGLCIVFRKSVLQQSLAEVLGATIHEAGHHAAAYDNPSRDDDDHVRAVQTFWTSGMCGADGGHNSRWVRATVHLWWRALCAGRSVKISDVMRTEMYGMPHEKELSDSLLPECSQRDNEDVESILATPAPSAFCRLFPGERLERTSKRPAPSGASASVARRPQSNRAPVAVAVPGMDGPRTIFM